MTDELGDLISAVLDTTGQLTIVRGPIENYEAVYDHDTDTLRIDPDAAALPAIVDVLRDVVYGPPDRQFAVLACGDASCVTIPRQVDNEGQYGRARLRVVGHSGATG